MKYRKKPVVIEAIQFTGGNGWEVARWSDRQAYATPALEVSEDNPTGQCLKVDTLEGTMTAIVGDWIIRGIKGELYPCKPDIFEATYEPAE